MQPDKWILKELKDLKDYILKYLRKHYIMLLKKSRKRSAINTNIRVNIVSTSFVKISNFLLSSLS